MNQHNEKFEIEKNVPIPATRHSTKFGVSKYPFADMNVGDSFLVRESDSKKYLVANRIRIAIHRHKARNKNSNFSTLFVEDGVRVWRIA